MKQVFATLDGLAARWIASDVAVLVLRAGLALMFVESAADKALNFGLYAEEVAGMGHRARAIARHAQPAEVHRARAEHVFGLVDGGDERGE